MASTVGAKSRAHPARAATGTARGGAREFIKLSCAERDSRLLAATDRESVGRGFRTDPNLCTPQTGCGSHGRRLGAAVTQSQSAAAHH